MNFSTSATAKRQPDLFRKFFELSETVIIGKERELKLALTCFLARGHLLIEDLPGMGKTTFAMLLSQVLGLRLSRIQFTNDLLPSDIIGTTIFNNKTNSFQFHQGPIFGELVLGDELNRATPKTQSAFLQAMEEHKVSVDGQTYDLPKPFFLIATQNPINQTGTYPLPESQLDRFMMRIHLGYPDKAAERKILIAKDPRKNLNQIKELFSHQEILELQELSQTPHVSPALLDYVQEILILSRQMATQGSAGLSPRAGLLLVQAARARAFIEARDMVLPEDIQEVAPSVMGHRLSGTEHALEIIQKVKVP